MQTFHDLLLWQKAHALVLAVYTATRAYPREELYGLTSQTRRAATSIPGNIVEGYGRQGRREFRAFINQALGSACELEYWLFLGRDLGFLPAESWRKLTDQTIEVIKLAKAWLAKLDAENAERR